MKVILAGSTGFIGHEVLTQCLQNPAITSVVALSRRELPAHEKLRVALVDNFLSYPDSVREEIKGADACIWYELLLIPCKPKPCIDRVPTGRWARHACQTMTRLDE